MKEANVISVSGGKDSTATLLTAIERGAENLTAVFADTGNEHPQTYDYVRYLEQVTGVKITWVKADFSEQIERKRARIADNDNDWPEDLRQRALSVLQPTGNPYLDLCLWKGRFPSRMAQFCTHELKVGPMQEQVLLPLMSSKEYGKITCWQGVRADESLNRAKLPEWDAEMDDGAGGGLWNYRPILRWSVEDVFEAHRRHGIKWNPLYEQGMSRVGCMPCINCNKNEMRQIAGRFPEELERIAEWERLVSDAAKRGMATFFAVKGVANDNINLNEHGVMARAEWSKTTRGGKQYDLINAVDETAPACQSAYGLCE